MTDLERSTLQRALIPEYDAPLPFAEALQAETLQPETRSSWPAVAERSAAEPSWNPDCAHARLRLLSGIVGLLGTALIVALFVMGAPAHG